MAGEKTKRMEEWQGKRVRRAGVEEMSVFELLVCCDFLQCLSGLPLGLLNQSYIP